MRVNVFYFSGSVKFLSLNAGFCVCWVCSFHEMNIVWHSTANSLCCSLILMVFHLYSLYIKSQNCDFFVTMGNLRKLAFIPVVVCCESVSFCESEKNIVLHCDFLFDRSN